MATSSNRPTRRRGGALDTVIHEATLAELKESGYWGVTFAAVARRAHTSRTVLYRRYHSRALLVSAAAAAQVHMPSTPAPTSSLREDLHRLFEVVISPAQLLGPEVTRALFGEADLTLMNEIVGFTREPTRRSLDEIVTAARNRGELGASTIPETALLAPFTVLRQEALEREITKGILNDIVEQIALPLYAACSTDLSTSAPGLPS